MDIETSLFVFRGSLLNTSDPPYLVVMGRPASELQAGVDYPRNRIEFDDFFPDEDNGHVA